MFNFVLTLMILGLKLQGLFRISGSASTVLKFKDEFDRGNIIVLNEIKLMVF